jgi:hypothetical protein
MVALRGSCGIYINISCKYFTEGSVYLQHNVMLYIQKSVSENAGIAVIGVEKYKNFLGEKIRLLLNAIPHQTFCYQQPSIISPHLV